MVIFASKVGVALPNIRRRGQQKRVNASHQPGQLGHDSHSHGSLSSIKWAQYTTHLDGAVVLADWVVELDADPGLAILGVQPDESDDTVTLALHGNPIANGDVAADLQVPAVGAREPAEVNRA